MDLKTKKAFTLAELAVVFVIIALIAVAGIKITKSRTNHVNKYMSYAAFTNLKQGMGELIADNKTLPAYGVAPSTVTCNAPPSISVTPATSSASIPYTASASQTTGTFNVVGTGGTGTVTITSPTVPSGGSVTMSPTSFTIANGGTQTVSFTATSPANSESTSTFTFGFSASIADGNSATHNHTQNRSAAPLTPDPSATCDDSGVTFTNLQVASADTAVSAIYTCSDTTWDSHTTANIYCATNYWAGAKKACYDTASTPLHQWRLPTKNELCSMYKYRAYISAPMSAAFYWSATEYTAHLAWTQHFNTGYQSNDLKYGHDIVRCVR